MTDVDDSKEFKAKLDDDDILEELGLTDRAVLDSDGILDDISLDDPEQQKAPPPSDKKEEQKTSEKPSEKQSAPSFLSRFAPFSNRLARYFIRIKSIPFINIAFAAGIAFVCFIISVFVLDQYFTKRSETDYKDFLSSIKEAVSTGLPGKSEDLETIAFAPFLVPVLDMERGESFLRASFLIKIKETDIDRFENNQREIRKAIFDYMKTIDPRDTANDKKRRLIEMEIKKIINSALRKQAVHDIVIEELIVT